MYPPTTHLSACYLFVKCYLGAGGTAEISPPGPDHRGAMRLTSGKFYLGKPNARG